MSAAQSYEAAVRWQTPEINQRPAPLFPAPGEDYPCYQLDREHVALIHSVPARIRGRVLYAERERDPSLRDYVLHVALALSRPASWPVLWRLDRTRLEYSGAYRVAVTPGYTLSYSDAAGQFAARLVYRHRSNLLHVHLIDRWPLADERLTTLKRGARIEIRGAVCTLARGEPSGHVEPLFFEVEPPECWCIHPLEISGGGACNTF